MSCRALNHRFAGYLTPIAGALAFLTAPASAATAGAAQTASASPVLFAAPVAHAAIAGQGGSLVRVTLALILVLAAVFPAAWFSRRMHGVGSSRSPALEVIAQLPLGPRERAVLVRVGSQQVLLGVASGNVRALHVLPVSATPASGATDVPAVPETTVPPAPGERPTFRSMLLKSLGK